MSSVDQKAVVRRLIYVSQAMGDADLLAILRQSRTNNGIDGVSGVLTFNGDVFGQVLEGSSESVEAVFERIRRDRRHTAIAVVSDTIVSERLFAEWTMAGLSGDFDDVLRLRLERLLEDAPARIRLAFQLD